MNDIYNIQAWTQSTSYEVDSIVIYNNFYYYTRTKHVSSSSFDNDYNSNLWKGKLIYAGQILPYFEWKTSYNYDLDIKPDVKKIQFGDGYIQDINANINSILLPINLPFEERSLNEYTAILHFLAQRKGSQRFFYIPPAPFNVVKRFVCQNWKPGQVFLNNYSIQCVFEERII